MLRIQIAEQVADIGRNALGPWWRRSRALPEVPLGARMVHTEARTHQHQYADDEESVRVVQPAASARLVAMARIRAECRNIGIALKQAQRAGDIAADMLEAERTADGRRHADGDEYGTNELPALSERICKHAHPSARGAANMPPGRQ